MEVDEIAVPLQIWEAAIKGDVGAISSLRLMCDGLVIYEHCLVLDGESSNYKFATARELNDLLFRSRMTLTIGFDA